MRVGYAIPTFERGFIADDRVGTHREGEEDGLLHLCCCVGRGYAPRRYLGWFRRRRPLCSISASLIAACKMKEFFFFHFLSLHLRDETTYFLLQYSDVAHLGPARNSAKRRPPRQPMIDAGANRAPKFHDPPRAAVSGHAAASLQSPSRVLFRLRPCLKERRNTSNTSMRRSRW